MTDPELRDAIRELDELVKYSAIATNDQKHAALYRVCRHLTNVLKTVTRSHPAPPPSPSEENAQPCVRHEAYLNKGLTYCRRCGVQLLGDVENAGEELTDQYIREAEIAEKARAEGYQAGKQHQASADAATIAALLGRIFKLRGAVSLLADGADSTKREHARLTLKSDDDAASLRPEPDELTDGPDPIHEGDR